MSHLHRFYIPNGIFAAGALVSLPEEEAHHALRVVRLREGDEVAFFDGHGNGGRGILTNCGKRSALISVSGVTRQPLPGVRITAAPAWLHRDKPVEEILRRCTELGVTHFAFWRAERSQKAPAEREKWQKILVESCKQCGRDRLPELAVYEDLASFLDMTPGVLLAASESAVSPVVMLDPNKAYTMIIGPEGDFSEEELAWLRERSVQWVQLGNYTLRTEVATVALATLTLNALGRLGTQMRLGK